jgi:DNA-directed RNA polymerase
MKTPTPSITDQLIESIEKNPEWDRKFDRQVQLEEKMRGMGVDRYWTNVTKARERGQETSTAPVRRLMGQATVDIAEGIREFLTECETGKAGRKHTAHKFLKQIEPEAAALITARVVLDGVAKGDIMVSLARKVAVMVEDELAFRQFKEADRNSYDWLVKREKRVNGTSYRRQRLVMKHNMKARGIEVEEWTAREQLLVGSKLIEIMMVKTGLVQRVTRAVDAKRQEVYIEATPATMDWINEESNRCEAMSPVYLPTIIPPRPWTSPFEGGYWTPRVRRLALVKTHSRAYLEELAEHDMPQVYDAVNAMQHTAWAVNTQVLEVMRTLWDRGSLLGGIPSAEDFPLPPKPQFLEEEKPKETWSDEELGQFKRWKRDATETYTKNAKLKSLRLQFVKTLTVAELFADEEEIYFPHQLDFRGRAYAVPMFLNPQGSDVAKGLLTFADAAAINDQEGADWLAIHGSNSYGFDKAPMRDRVQWVKDHEAEILASAEDPYSNTFWASADAPWQFLAFCFEWAEFKAEGFGYLSTLPVQMDGSCNGLQNFSAMLRDSIGGAAVNLIPADRPADVYQQVADVVLKRVEKDAQSDDERLAHLARGWLKHGITRKVCKRPVMTLAYGAKAFGFKQQVFEDTVQPYKYSVGVANFPWEDSGWGAADYMGKLIWECVGEVVVAARQAMDWLQTAAKAAAKEGLPVRWETPDGLVVLQAYPKMLSKRIDLTFNGARHLITLATEPSKELDKSKQANGISPNWVHSMDAAHMRATVRRCWDEGIHSFSLVHDSYGTHAANAWALAKFLREEFVMLYEEDVLDRFKCDLELQLPEDVQLPELPPKGDLDLATVEESVYFFA